MGRYFYLFLLLFCGLGMTAQDDIYDAPEKVKPQVQYGNQNTNRSSDGSYENIDDSYNPEYDYRYRRSLRRMYDPDYVMPSSAYLNMYTYPQFANFYNPYWGWNSGFSITIGNSWGSPWGWNNGWNAWNNPYGWNSWNSWYAWNSPWGWNSWNSWNNPWCGGGWNSWGGGWNDPYWGGGWNNSRWNGRGNNWGSGQRNSVTPPERRISRAVRVMDPNRDYGNTTYRPSQPQGNSGWNNGGNSRGSNTPTYRNTPSNSAPSQGTVTPAPTRMGGNSPSGGGGGSSGGGGRSGGRSGGSSRF